MMTNIKLTAFDFNYIVNHIYGIALRFVICVVWQIIFVDDIFWLWAVQFRLTAFFIATGAILRAVFFPSVTILLLRVLLWIHEFACNVSALS